MRKRFFEFFDLTSDLNNVDEIYTSIVNGISFRGTNLWILVFAIVIASVGLNTNSPAVIIGAMLISPLMGPINGIGYSIATYDFELFKKAIKNFSFAVAASLAASTIYFSITPLSAAHTELLARTSPTIYDVLIALFGGLAGILAISSRHKGNVIPGVAIATALMPPLCTAGYGLATGQFRYFFGAFYLFTINSVFIAISSVLFSQILNFPIRTIVEPKHKRHVNRTISIIIAITIIPSIYFGYLLIEKEKFVDRANHFLSKVDVVGESYLLRHEVLANERTVRLVYAGMSLTEDARQKVLDTAGEHGIDSSQVAFVQALSLNSVTDDISEVDNYLKVELNRLSLALKDMKKQRDSVSVRDSVGQALLTELSAFYPQVESLVYTETIAFSVAPDSANNVPFKLVVLKMKGPLKVADKTKIRDWLTQRVRTDRVRVVYE